MVREIGDMYRFSEISNVSSDFLLNNAETPGLFMNNPGRLIIIGNKPLLFPYDFDQDSFSSAAVKLAVENLLPGAEIQFSACDRYHDFPAHNCSF